MLHKRHLDLTLRLNLVLLLLRQMVGVHRGAVHIGECGFRGHVIVAHILHVGHYVLLLGR